MDCCPLLCICPLLGESTEMLPAWVARGSGYFFSVAMLADGAVVNSRGCNKGQHAQQLCDEVGAICSEAPHPQTYNPAITITQRYYHQGLIDSFGEEGMQLP